MTIKVRALSIFLHKHPEVFTPTTAMFMPVMSGVISWYPFGLIRPNAKPMCMSPTIFPLLQAPSILLTIVQHNQARNKGLLFCYHVHFVLFSEHLQHLKSLAILQ